MEHVSHFNQKMAVHSKDETLMCKIFPSSLGPMAMKWFNGLKANSIDSFKKLIQSFGARFITCSRVPLPLGSLLSMSMREGETLKAYFDRYWEMFNEIDRSYNNVAISTFKAGLPTEHDLRKSLSGKPVTSVRLLMDRIDKYRRIEEDQLQGKGKMKAIPQERRDSRSDQTQNNRPRRDHHSSCRGCQSSSVFQGNAAPKPPLGTINVIFAALGRTGSCSSRVMSVSSYSDDDLNLMPKRIKDRKSVV